MMHTVDPDLSKSKGSSEDFALPVPPEEQRSVGLACEEVYFFFCKTCFFLFIFL